ncbi:MAG TPA: nuclear transport factor 2 family protein [Longimicrobiales bacterium]|nr:nuclear transport factor 2 family protein [Longimicrobiales bacterium]
MSVADQLLHLEEQFWTSDETFYRDNLTPDALMVFADPVGAMTKQAIVESISAAPRWRSVEFRDVTHVPLTSDVILLTYQATAERDGGDASYTARASSVYVQRGSRWRLAFHQQTP